MASSAGREPASRTAGAPLAVSQMAMPGANDGGDMGAEAEVQAIAPADTAARMAAGANEEAQATAPAGTGAPAPATTTANSEAPKVRFCGSVLVQCKFNWLARSLMKHTCLII